MSTMYRLPPFVQENVTPAEIMYKLPSYHTEANNVPNTSASSCSVSELADLLRESVQLTTDLTRDILNYVKQRPASSGDAKQKPQPQEKKESKKQKREEADSEGATHFRGNVVFHYKLQNYKKLDGQLEVSYGIKATLTAANGKKSNYEGFAPVLTVLGEVVGLYSQQDPNLRQTSHWLNLADEVLTNKTAVDSVIREMSRHLGAFDLLNKIGSVTLPDLVLYVLVKSTTVLPNNVEMFVNRIAEALASA